LQFNIPTITPLSPQARLVEDDPSYISLYRVFENHCQKIGIHKDDPIAFFLRRTREVMMAEDISKKSKVDVLNMKTEIMEEVAKRMIPESVLSQVCFTMILIVSTWLLK
jgi:transformation/transcription domain-associated protein